MTLTAAQNGERPRCERGSGRNAPMAIAKDHTVRLDAIGNARIEANDINNGSFDNCNIADMLLSQEVFNDTGAFPVTLTVVDDSGNRHTATAVIIVEPYAAQTGDVFTVSDMEYEITAVTPNEVKVIDYIGSATAVEIPETVS